MGRKLSGKRDSYGAWLCHLRKEKGFSQVEFAKKTGIPQSTLAFWEKTGKLTGREIIFKLAKALGVSVEELLRAGK